MTVADSSVAVVKAVNKSASVKNYIFDIKSSLFFRHDWGTMLVAVPVCLELLGTCNMLASTHKASTTELTPPREDIAYLRGHRFLQTALVEVGNHGRHSFLCAHKQMSIIKECSNGAKHSTVRIFQALSNAEVDYIEMQMSQLKIFADRCVHAADEMNADFTHWQNYVMELHEACTESQSTNEVVFQTVSSKEEAMKMLEKQKMESLKLAEKTMAKMESQLEEDHNAYLNKLEKFPTDSDLLQQTLTVTAVDAVADILHKAASAAAAYVNPASTIGGVAASLAELKKEGEDTTEAVALAENIKGPLSELQSILTGSAKDGVDWERVQTGENTGSKEETDKGMTLGAIEILLKSHTNDTVEGKAGKAIGDAIKSTLEVVTTLQAQAKGANNANGDWKKPAKSDQVVKDWTDTVAAALAATTKLIAQHKSSPGIPIGKAPNMVPGIDLRTRDKAQALNDAIVAAAQAALDSSQKAYIATQEIYRKSSDKVLEVQDKLGNLRAELEQLEADKITLEVVRGVLRDCIIFIKELKDKIMELTQFFSTLSVMITSAINKQVKPYADNVELANKRFGDKRMVEALLLSTTLQYAMTITAYFALYEDIGNMYLRTHDEHIHPGFCLIEEMANSSSGDIDIKKLRLKQYSTDASVGIKQTVKAKGANIIEDLDARIKEINRLLKAPDLPKLPAQIEDAIKTGSAAAQAEIEKEIKEKHPGYDTLSKSKEVRKNSFQTKEVKADPC